MKVAAQEIENSQVVLDIQVEDERLEKAVDQAYRRIVGRINVPGFRKGKAPRALVERMVGREALVEDAVEHLVPEVVEAAVKEQELKMVARPRLEIVSTQPLQLKATVPVQPKVELGDYRSLEIEAPEAKIDDEQVEQVINRLRESHATWEPVERPVAIGDRVAIDVHGEVNGQDLTRAKDAEYVVDPNGPEPAPGFANQLVGLNVDDERSFVLNLPEDYRNSALAGQPANFTVTVHGIKEKRLPELDDEFASTVDTEHETLEQLRDHIRQQLLEREQGLRSEEHRESVIQAVVDQAAVELPPQMVEEETDRLIEQFGQTLERQGIPLQQYLRYTDKSEAQLRSELTATAERTVRRQEVLNAVAVAEGIEPTDDEIRAEIAAAARDRAEAERISRQAFRRPETRERLATVLRQRQAREFLLKTVGGIEDDSQPAEAAEDETPATVAVEAESTPPVAAGATTAAEVPGETPA